MDAETLFDVFDVDTFYEEIQANSAYSPCKLMPGLTVIQGGKIIYLSDIEDNGKQTQSQGTRTWSDRVRPE